jgi:hypothetical protein
MLMGSESGRRWNLWFYVLCRLPPGKIAEPNAIIRLPRRHAATSSLGTQHLHQRFRECE